MRLIVQKHDARRKPMQTIDLNNSSNEPSVFRSSDDRV
jgi:hypothetical protein